MADTIVFQNARAAFWYFTSTREPDPINPYKRQKVNGPPRILRKKENKLCHEEIEKAFLKNVGPSGIVAVYFYHKPRLSKDPTNDYGRSNWTWNDQIVDRDPKPHHEVFLPPRPELDDSEARVRQRKAKLQRQKSIASKVSKDLEGEGHSLSEIAETDEEVDEAQK